MGWLKKKIAEIISRVLKKIKMELFECPCCKNGVVRACIECSDGLDIVFSKSECSNGKCSKCGGRGDKEEKEEIPEDELDYVRDLNSHAPLYPRERYRTVRKQCFNCGGTGKCPTCGGTGIKLRKCENCKGTGLIARLSF